jgi:hypothetical protein
MESFSIDGNRVSRRQVVDLDLRCVMVSAREIGCAGEICRTSVGNNRVSQRRVIDLDLRLRDGISACG